MWTIITFASGLIHVVWNMQKEHGRTGTWWAYRQHFVINGDECHWVTDYSTFPSSHKQHTIERV